MSQRGDLYSVMSDASVMRDGAGIAWVVMAGDAVVARGSSALSERDAPRAELEATYRAMSAIPGGNSVVVFSDLDDIIGIMNEAVSYSPKLADKVARIREQEERIGSVEYRRVDGSRRHYKWCHKMARQAAFGVG